MLFPFEMFYYSRDLNTINFWVPGVLEHSITKHHSNTKWMCPAFQRLNSEYQTYSSSIQLEFKSWTIWRPTSFPPFDYQTHPAFWSPLYDFLQNGISCNLSSFENRSIFPTEFLSHVEHSGDPKAKLWKEGSYGTFRFSNGF